MARIKIRRLKHRWPKELGYPNEKWARGGGKNGYARSYGHYKGLPNMRTRAEYENDQQRKLATQSQTRAENSQED